MASDLTAHVIGENIKAKKLDEWENTVKPSLVKAIKKGGNTLYVRINVASIKTETVNGGKLILEGDPEGKGIGFGKVHEITEALVKSDSFSPMFGSEIVSYLDTVAYNSDKKNAKHPQSHTKGWLSGGKQVRVNLIDVFSEKSYLDEIRKRYAVSEFPGAPTVNAPEPEIAESTDDSAEQATVIS